MKEKSNKDKYKEIGFLQSLEEEILYAKKNNWESLEEIKKNCLIYKKLLSFIKDKMDIVPNSIKDYSYIISDIDIPPENTKQFYDLALDLISRGIIYNKNSSTTVLSSNTINEIINGKNIVVKDKKNFIIYIEKLNEIVKDINNPFELIAYDSFMSKPINIPKNKPIFSYDTKEAFYHKGKIKIPLNLKGLPLELFVYFLNNAGKHIPEETIENELELFIKNTGDKRGDRATYQFVHKLNSQLKKSTGKEIARRIVNNNAQNTWIFEPEALQE